MRVLTSKEIDDIDCSAEIECRSYIEPKRFSYSQRNCNEAQELIKKYTEFFKKHKGLSMPFMLGHGQWAFSKLEVNLSESISSEQHIRNEIQINSSCDLVELMRLNEPMHVFTSEALTMTYPSEKFINICKRFQDELVPNELKSKSQRDVEHTGSSSQRFIDTLELTDFDDTSKAYGRIVIPFLTYNADLDVLQENIKNLADIARFNGYFISQAQTVEVDDADSISAVYVAFEAKYAKKDIELNDTICHCTSLKNLPSILKKGIKPKAASANFNSSDSRIYFFNFSKQYEIAGCAEHFIGNEFAVLHIRRSKLESYAPYSSGKMAFYIDPRLPNLDNEKKPFAIYTYEPIPKSLIEDDIKIVQIDNSGHRTVTSSKLSDWKS